MCRSFIKSEKVKLVTSSGLSRVVNTHLGHSLSGVIALKSYSNNGICHQVEQLGRMRIQSSFMVIMSWYLVSTVDTLL